ncbi:MAG TPA: pilus assembly protein PilM [Candidatus Angelobacter sp.]|nr:pilus assembly protein PilM [Candidatus Angelobacter sp.]
MALPFFNGAKLKDQTVSVDLGGRTTKAVQIQRKGSGFVLSSFALLDAPVYEKSLSPEMLGEHLKNVCQALGLKSRSVTLAVSVGDSLMRHAEMPMMPVDDMRQILKINSKTYLQQELQGYVFDCHIFSASLNQTANGGKTTGAVPKSKVLVAGAKRQFIDELQDGLKRAGLGTDAIVPGVIGPVNALELAMPDVFSQNNVALVDIGFKSSSISVLQQGELILNRVVSIGGDRLTAGLAEAMNVSYAEAEGIKVGMPTEVQAQLESLMMPLGRELRASIDFFEHQQEKTVSQVFVSGASARSELMLQILQSEMSVECKSWNPAAAFELQLPPQQAGEFEHIAPQLSVAIGAALAVI